MTPSDAEVQELFFRYGETMYHAHNFEIQLKFMVRMVFSSKYPKLTPEQREQELNKQSGMGALMKILKERTSVPESVEKAWNHIFEQRNELAHSFFWEHRKLLETSDGHQALIQHLKNVTQDFKTLDDHLCKTADKWAEKQGLPARLLEQPTV